MELKHKTLNCRKCTEAGINSSITVPSKVLASQDPTKKRVTCSSKSIHRVVDWFEGWHPLPNQDSFWLFTIDPSIVRAVPVLTKVAQFSLDQKMSEREVTLFFNFKGTLFLNIF